MGINTSIFKLSAKLWLVIKNKHFFQKKNRLAISKIRKLIQIGTTFLLNSSGKHRATNRAPCSSNVEEIHKWKKNKTKKPQTQKNHSTTDWKQSDRFKCHDIRYRIKIEQKEQQKYFEVYFKYIDQRKYHFSRQLFLCQCRQDTFPAWD